MTNATRSIPKITLRVPGDWSHPSELLSRLPQGYRLSPEYLRLPDGKQIEFTPMPPDDELPRVFRSACRRSPTDDELATLDRYRVAVGLTGPGGSMESARIMMQAGAAIVRAGGAGVFIDNSVTAHGGSDWIAMTEDSGPDALSFAFVSIVRGSRDVYTVGMHVLGYSDLVMDAADADENGETFVELIRYICGGHRPVDVGQIVADEFGPRFQVVSRGSDSFDAESPFHNPLGRLKFVNPRRIVEGN